MKMFRRCLLYSFVIIAALLGARAGLGTDTQSGDLGWPRQHVRDGNRLIVYQPQVDDWKNFHDLAWRMAVSLTPKGGKEVVGVVEMKGTTQVDNDNKVVLITDP